MSTPYRQTQRWREIRARWKKLNAAKWWQIRNTSRRSPRLEAIYRYSLGTMVCACCGWTLPDGAPHRAWKLLEIDHINGGGTRHMKQSGVGNGENFARWLRRNGYPPGYRVLDAGCNHMMKPRAKKCAAHGGPLP